MTPRRGSIIANNFPVFTLTIATGVQDRPADAPEFGQWKSDWKVVGNPSFAEAMSAVASLVLAYGGLPAYFSIVSEMKILATTPDRSCSVKQQPRLSTSSSVLSSTTSAGRTSDHRLSALLVC